MKRITKILSGLLVIVALMGIVGCGYSKEEKAEMAGFEKLAKANAIEYIQNKYGFKPEVTGTKVLKVDPGPVPDFFPSATGMVNVSMKYNDVEFMVNITGEEKSTDGKDTYQKKEIEDAFKAQLENKLGIKIETVDSLYSKECFISEKFTDLDSFLNGTESGSAVDIVVKTFDEIPEDKVNSLNYDNVFLMLISCRNQSGLDIISDYEYLTRWQYTGNFYRTDAMDRKMAEYSLFMNGYVFRNMDGEVHSLLFDYKKIDDGMFLVYEKGDNAIEPNVIETKDMAPASDWSRASGKAKSLPTFENPEKVSKSYAVDFGDHLAVQIFMLPEKKSSEEKASRYVALQYIDEEGNEVFDHIATTDIEGMYSFELERMNDLKIALMINKK